MYYIVAAYIISSIILAYLGRNSRLKFWGVLLTSLYMTPLVVGGVLLFFGTSCPKPELKKEAYPVPPTFLNKKSWRPFSNRDACSGMK